MNEKLPVLELQGFVQSEETPFVYVNRLSRHLRQNHLLISHPHKHDFFLTVLFTKGGGQHTIDFRTYSVTPGSVFFLRPGQSHHWELSEDTDGYILFHTRLIDSHMPLFAFHAYVDPYPLMVLPHADLETFRISFRLLLDEYEQGRAYRDRKLLNLIDNLYIDLARRYTDDPAESQPSATHYFQKFEMLLEAHYRNEKQPSFYAEKLFVSPRHLSRMTREYYGKTPGELIARRVVLEAKRMLIHGAGSLTDISQSLGFDDYAYFSRYFKRVEGKSPSAFLAGTG